MESLSQLLQGVSENDLAKGKMKIEESLRSVKENMVEFVKKHKTDFDKFLSFSQEYTDLRNSIEMQKLWKLESKKLKEEIESVDKNILKRKLRLDILGKVKVIEASFCELPEHVSEYSTDDLEYFSQMEKEYFSEDYKDTFRNTKVYIRYLKRFEKRKKQLISYIKSKRYFFDINNTMISFPKGDILKFQEIMKSFDLFDGFVETFFRNFKTYVRKVVVGESCDFLKEEENGVVFLKKTEELSISRVDRINRRLYGVFRVLEIVGLQNQVDKEFCTYIRKAVLSPIISTLGEEEIIAIKKIEGPIPKIFRDNVLGLLEIYQFLATSEQRIRRIRALLIDHAQIMTLEGGKLEILLGSYEIVECLCEWVDMLVVESASKEDQLLLVMKQHLLLILDLFVILCVDSKSSGNSRLMERSAKYVIKRIDGILLKISRKTTCIFRNDVYFMLMRTKNSVN